MKKIGIAYMVIGVVALVGAAVAAFVLINLYGALGAINSADPSQLPAGTDIATLRDTVQSLNMLITLGSVWILSVVLAGIICIRSGIANLRTRKIKAMGR